MADIGELAMCHVMDHGMDHGDAVAMLVQFAQGEGRDIEWQAIAPTLAKPLAERIDRAASGWLMAHRAAVVAQGVDNAR